MASSNHITKNPSINNLDCIVIYCLTLFNANIKNAFYFGNSTQCYHAGLIISFNAGVKKTQN